MSILCEEPHEKHLRTCNAPKFYLYFNSRNKNLGAFYWVIFIWFLTTPSVPK